MEFLLRLRIAKTSGTNVRVSVKGQRSETSFYGAVIELPSGKLGFINGESIELLIQNLKASFSGATYTVPCPTKVKQFHFAGIVSSGFLRSTTWASGFPQDNRNNWGLLDLSESGGGNGDAIPPWTRTSIHRRVYF